MENQQVEESKPIYHRTSPKASASGAFNNNNNYYNGGRITKSFYASANYNSKTRRSPSPNFIFPDCEDISQIYPTPSGIKDSRNITDRTWKGSAFPYTASERGSSGGHISNSIRRKNQQRNMDRLH